MGLAVHARPSSTGDAPVYVDTISNAERLAAHLLGLGSIGKLTATAMPSYINAAGEHRRSFHTEGMFEYGLDRVTGGVRYFTFWPYHSMSDRFTRCEPVDTDSAQPITVVTSSVGDSYYSPTRVRCDGATLETIRAAGPVNRNFVKSK